MAKINIVRTRKFICFVQMTAEFLKLSLEERKSWIPTWNEMAKKHGLKVLFYGTTLGVREHVVVVFESAENSDSYLKFQRERQGLGTREAGKLIEYKRTITILYSARALYTPTHTNSSIFLILEYRFGLHHLNIFLRFTKRDSH